jgi:aryl-alcohol dehydrogenase-like predicted oxidoreductase
VIPGTGDSAHLEENFTAASIMLSDAEMHALEPVAHPPSS